MTFDDVLTRILDNEGGYVNNPADPGGETKFGITATVARANGYTGRMMDLPRPIAVEIYKSIYIVAPGFGQVGNLSMPIAAELADTGVNMGVTVAARFLQRALNGLADGPALVLDGHLGAVSQGVLKTFLVKRGAEGERRLLALLNAQQGVRYLELTEAKSSLKTFLYGWLARITS